MSEKPVVRLPPPPEPPLLAACRAVSLAAALVLSAVGLPLAAGAQSRPPTLDVLEAKNACGVVDFKQENKGHLVSMTLGWTTSSVWIEAKGTGSRDQLLLVVDTPAETFKKIGLDGVIEERVDILTKAKPSGVDKLLPFVVSAAADGSGSVAMAYTTGRPSPDQKGYVLFMNESGAVETTLLATSMTLDDPPLRSVQALTPMADGVLLFGFLDGPPRPAFVYLQRDGGSYETFDHEVFRSESWNTLFEMFTLDYTYLTALGDVGYVLVQTETPWVGKIELGSGELVKMADVPADFARVPKLGQERRRSMAIDHMFEVYGRIAETPMPTGIHGWGGRLFIIAKEARAADGSTAWWLLEVHPGTGEEMDRYRIPTTTTAASVLAVPGQTWGIVQKGPVEKVGPYPGQHLFRDTSSMVLFPGKWLDPGHLKLKSGDVPTCISLSPLQ
jgi:hypothetical protein